MINYCTLSLFEKAKISALFVFKETEVTQRWELRTPVDTGTHLNRLRSSNQQRAWHRSQRISVQGAWI